MKTIEVSGPSVEEAVARGLAKLGATRDEVDIEVLSRGSRGFLGLGAREAVVRISLRPREDIKLAAKEALQELLAKMGVQAEVSIRSEEETPQGADAPPFILDVTGRDLGILIGRRGQTLQALQYITRLIVSREAQRWVNLVVDVERYKARREKSLRELARRMAEQVAFTRQPIALEPMPPHERRIIHLALRDHPLVTTKSVGKGDKRRVTIIPKK
ncbi:MAG TPA: protein jag [Anaerolineae bacterium]|nr:protein jag [Anaerolineae bacterium]